MEKSPGKGSRAAMRAVLRWTSAFIVRSGVVMSTAI
jgi:hypothetical protein